MAGAPHDIVVVIPVADRPQHLADCLHSLLELLRRFPYGGKVSVLVADDSLGAENLARHRAICEEVTAQGLAAHHLSQDEQRALVAVLPSDARTQLNGVIGDGTGYAHKGASITRNIAYLWLAQLQRDGAKRLFWFIDSDQEFRVNVDTADGEEQLYVVDYCNSLDRIFNTTPAQMLTGKVVGDPPVSPAVMAGNFLDDVAAFLGDMAHLTPQAACAFHTEARHADDAAYHDMADLFGFRQADAFRYRCTLEGTHDNARCFADFAAKLARFFDGEHPTRRSVYEATDLMASVKPARTVYTGNYVFTPAVLDWFIPFADLKLRMAGPTLGRIVKAELGERFVSANLPMLHKRTVETIGQSEFRPGIERSSERIDLSGEFERQYFGDVMLFTMEKLTAAGYPGIALNSAMINTMVDETEQEMRERYAAKHRQIGEKIARLRALFEEPGQWWQQKTELAEARTLFTTFIDNMDHNFGDDSRAWRIINNAEHQDLRKEAIANAVAGYHQDRQTWHEALEVENGSRVEGQTTK